MGSVPVRDQFCWEFTDTDLFGKSVFLHVDGTFVVPASVGWDEKDDEWRRDLAVHLPYTVVPSVADYTSTESAFVLIDRFRFESNFGMWHYETLPKLATYAAYCERTGTRPTLVVPILTDLQVRSLDILGFEDRCELGDERLRADEVIILTQTGWSWTSRFDTPPSDIRWVRDELVSAVSPSDRFADRVYVSRADADFRHVDNEAAVMDVLRPLGFERYALAELSLRDQMRLFASADILVGPHGAGMAHMVHAEDAAFVELFPGEAGVIPYYFVLANGLDHRYEFVICGAGANEHPESDHPRHANLVVDADELERVISQQISDGS